MTYVKPIRVRTGRSSRKWLIRIILRGFLFVLPAALMVFQFGCPKDTEEYSEINKKKEYRKLPFEADEYLGYIKFNSGEEIDLRLDLDFNPEPSTAGRTGNSEVSGKLTVVDDDKLPAVLVEHGRMDSYTVSDLQYDFVGPITLDIDTPTMKLSRDVELVGSFVYTGQTKQYELLKGHLNIDGKAGGKFEFIRPSRPGSR